MFAEINSHDLPPLIFMLAAVFAVVMAIFTRHQQKMALILRRPIEGSQPIGLDRLTEEVRMLREMAVEQALAIDRIESSLQRKSFAAEERALQERVS